MLSKNAFLSPYLYRAFAGDTMNYAERFRNPVTQNLVDLRSPRDIHPEPAAVALPGLSQAQVLSKHELRTDGTP